jgi:hypothetical protein
MQRQRDDHVVCMLLLLVYTLANPGFALTLGCVTHTTRVLTQAAERLWSPQGPPAP